jgi:hypothetical protein
MGTSRGRRGGDSGATGGAVVGTRRTSTQGVAGKFGSQTKVIHIWVADSTNPKICLPFRLPVGVLMFYTQFGFGYLNISPVEDSLWLSIVMPDISYSTGIFLGFDPRMPCSGGPYLPLEISRLPIHPVSLGAKVPSCIEQKQHQSREVVHWLDGTSLAALGCVSSAFHVLTSDPMAWRGMCLTIWPFLRGVPCYAAIGHSALFTNTFSFSAVSTPSGRRPPSPPPCASSRPWTCAMATLVSCLMSWRPTPTPPSSSVPRFTSTRSCKRVDGAGPDRPRQPLAQLDPPRPLH